MTELRAALARLPGWAAWLLCAAAGGLVPLSFAPFDLWPLALLGLVAFALLLDQQSGRTAWWRAWGFGIGLYGVGVSWIFISIHSFGNASAPLAAVMTGLFVLFVALVFSLPFYLYGRWFSQHPLGPLLAFAALYLLGEWLRGWLLTGFPWLYLGYGHLDTWLAGWAPVTGVLGLSLILLLTASIIAQWLLRPSRPRIQIAATLLVFGLWPIGWGLNQIEWTQPQGEPVTVGMIQPNIPQDRKWDPTFFEPTLKRLDGLSEDLWDNDWLIWPEAAIPRVYHQMLPYLETLNVRAEETETGFITGIIFDERRKGEYYNSVVGLGPALGIYHKRRLVPFGEYVPLEDWLRGLIDFFDLPTSIISRGPWEQSGLQIGDVGISASVCYEVVYPDLVARSARDRQVLLTISNDGWFADSIGPLQHMQMARMRALETGRPMIRATNNGVSAFVGHKGQIEKRAEQFVQTNLEGSVQPRSGITPFMGWGSWPVAILCGIVLVLLRVFPRR
ncbi:MULTISPECIES: apolipoprotein N-acyltransferase [unclassified Marinimicrobium]|jgi:apolipoprotein N-acyltransferase|uniref:apolipoprotein N-acyltransferase n=2 Tax=Marinimicrobium TaxID=359337 RepID=UPI000C61E9D3|nr:MULTISPECIES: apolipoprotein N-acyltransferase [unclassified Marinimicrobium]MAN51582.1 apolipoprotein N-acyltransferase [Marinimicrobium sp.]|tara:strand:- start:161 stop:1669 length:1509 start_codon:yes stop_codon:yes gene_type:complete